MDQDSRFVNTVSTAAKVPERDEIVVFWIVRDSACAECGDELGKGRFLRMEAERPLCLACADLDHLVFLGRGDAALTRRASRYSTLRAVVVRFSGSRKRYERRVCWWKKGPLRERNRNVCPTGRLVNWRGLGRLSVARNLMRPT